MIIGVNERLEKSMERYRDRRDDTEYGDVISYVIDSVAAGDYWHVPVDVIEDGMNETDFREGWILEHLPEFSKKTVRSLNDDEELFCAFTTEKKITVGTEEDLLTVLYPARDLLQELAAAEECAGMVLNPGSESVHISRESAIKILSYADNMEPEIVRSLQSYRIEPQAVLDTNEILEEWKDGYDNEDGRQEDWKLITYPIMADGRVLLLFEMRDEIHGGSYDTYEVIHTHSHYRVLEYRQEDGKLKLINKYRFKVQDADVSAVFLYDGILRAAISSAGRSTYKVVQMAPVDDDSQFDIFGSIETMVSNSRGDVVVAYHNNLRDKERIPVMAFDTSGDCTYNYRDEHALGCLDVNLDRDEAIWLHLAPSTTLEVFLPDTKKMESHRVAMQGFNVFSLSTDRSRLFAQFTDDYGASVQYIMRADENGDYIDPIRFEFLPEDDEGNVLGAEDCRVFGRASTMKSWVLLNANGKLYLYDIDDCCE